MALVAEVADMALVASVAEMAVVVVVAEMTLVVRQLAPACHFVLSAMCINIEALSDQRLR